MSRAPPEPAVPALTDIEKKIASVEAALAAGDQGREQLNARVLPRTALRVFQYALSRELQPGPAVEQIVENHLNALAEGAVVPAFAPDARAKLDAAARLHGLDRGAFVSLVVAENLAAYLDRGLARQAEQDAVFAKYPPPAKGKRK